jgi:hypothetical protein
LHRNPGPSRRNPAASRTAQRRDRDADAQRAEKGRHIFYRAEGANRDHVARLQPVGLHRRGDAIDQIVQPRIAQLALAIDHCNAIRRDCRGLSNQVIERDEIRHDRSLPFFLFCHCERSEAIRKVAPKNGIASSRSLSSGRPEAGPVGSSQ